MKNKVTLNDMIALFDAIDNIRPDSVLDIGMSMAKMNLTARQLGNRSLPSQTKLFGLGDDDDCTFPIYQTMYDAIYSDPSEVSDKNIMLGAFLSYTEDYSDKAKTSDVRYMLLPFSFVSDFEDWGVAESSGVFFIEDDKYAILRRRDVSPET